LVCLVTIAISDDFWSIATASSSSELLIVADDDSTDDSAQRMPACVLDSAGCTNLRSFARKPLEVIAPCNLKQGFLSRYGPRGPPADGSDQRGSANSPRFRTTAVDSSIVVPFPVAATPHHTLLEVQTPAAFSPNRTSGVSSHSRWVPWRSLIAPSGSGRCRRGLFAGVLGACARPWTSAPFQTKSRDTLVVRAVQGGRNG
jgi:hypothetical protein